MFDCRNIERRTYNVSPLPDAEAEKLLLEKVAEYNDKDNIEKLLKLCGGVPLLLQLAGSQLAINKGKTRNIVLEMLNEGEQVKHGDISDRMVGFVYHRLEEPVQHAFLDITAFFSGWESKYVSSIVGEEEFRGLEAASFVKTSENGWMIVHDIVKARGRMLAEEEGNRIRDVNTLLECLKDDEELEKLRGICFDLDGEHEQPAIEINSHHLSCMSGSLKMLCFEASQITFRGKCEKPFEQLRCLMIGGDVGDLPMEFEKLEHLVYYWGPFTQSMNLYEFPSSLRFMFVQDYTKKRFKYSEIPPKVTPASSLVELWLYEFNNMKRLPDGVEKLQKLERLTLLMCKKLGELPSNFGQLSSLTTLKMIACHALSALPSNFGRLKNLKELNLSECSRLAELPSDFGYLKSLKMLDLAYCSNLKEWPLSFRELTQITQIDLEGCSKKLKHSLPENFKQKIVTTD